MSQNNFVIQDIVEHVYKESDYRSSKIVKNTFRKMIKKLWIFILIIGLSAGIGYVAVYMPDKIAQEKKSLGGMDGMQKKLQGLSDAQKKELLKQFQGQR